MTNDQVLKFLSSMRGEEQRLLHSHFCHEGRYKVLIGKGKSWRAERTCSRDKADLSYDSLESIRELMAQFCEIIGMEYEDRAIHDLYPDEF